MPGNPFQQATKAQAKARVGLAGPSGSGKTYSALRIASAIGGPVACIDTEHGSASKYADEFRFDRVELSDFHPQKYVEMIQAAVANGYAVLVIDSITHEWSGPGGCLELVDLFAKKGRNGNKYAAWADVTPLHNAFIEAIHQAPIHILATMRSKMDYLQTEEGGRKAVQKVGMAPITREGVEYEFDLMLELDLSHTGAVTKSRAKAMTDKLYRFPGEEFARDLLAWLNAGQRGASPAEPQETDPPAAEPVASAAGEAPRIAFKTAVDAALAAGLSIETAQRWSLACNGQRPTKQWHAEHFTRAAGILSALAGAIPACGLEAVVKMVADATKGRAKWTAEQVAAVEAGAARLLDDAAGAAS